MKESDSAKTLGVSSSKLKKVKTKLGIVRWPFRRLETLKSELTSVQNQITNWKVMNVMQKNQQAEQIIKQLETMELNIMGTIQLLNQYPCLMIKYSNEYI